MNLLGFHFCQDEARAIAALVSIPALGYLWWRFRYLAWCVIDWVKCRARGHRHATHEHEHHAHSHPCTKRDTIEPDVNP